MSGRLLVLLGVAALAWFVVYAFEHRGRAFPASTVTLVVGEGCNLCPMARSVLERSGVPHIVVDAADAADLGVFSLPTLVGHRPDGSESWRRSGRAAVFEATRLSGGR